MMKNHWITLLQGLLLLSAPSVFADQYQSQGTKLSAESLQEALLRPENSFSFQYKAKTYQGISTENNPNLQSVIDQLSEEIFTTPFSRKFIFEPILKLKRDFPKTQEINCCHFLQQALGTSLEKACELLGIQIPQSLVSSYLFSISPKVYIFAKGSSHELGYQSWTNSENKTVILFEDLELEDNRSFISALKNMMLHELAIFLDSKADHGSYWLKTNSSPKVSGVRYIDLNTLKLAKELSEEVPLFTFRMLRAYRFEADWHAQFQNLHWNSNLQKRLERQDKTLTIEELYPILQSRSLNARNCYLVSLLIGHYYIDNILKDQSNSPQTLLKSKLNNTLNQLNRASHSNRKLSACQELSRYTLEGNFMLNSGGPRGKIGGGS